MRKTGSEKNILDKAFLLTIGTTMRSMLRKLLFLLLIGVISGCSEFSQFSNLPETTNDNAAEEGIGNEQIIFNDYWVCRELVFVNSDNSPLDTSSSMAWYSHYFDQRFDSFIEGAPADLPIENVLAFNEANRGWGMEAFNSMAFRLSVRYLEIDDPDLKNIFLNVNQYPTSGKSEEEIFNDLSRQVDAAYNFCKIKDYSFNYDYVTEQ